MQILLDAGVDIDAKDGNDNTPLSLACAYHQSFSV